MCGAGVPGPVRPKFLKYIEPYIGLSDPKNTNYNNHM